MFKTLRNCGLQTLVMSLAPIGVVALLSGCADVDPDDSLLNQPSNDDAVGVGTAALLSGANDVSRSVTGADGLGESETAAINSGGTEYIAYNANDDSKVTFAADGSSYTLCSGAIDIGYSMSTGGTWQRKGVSIPSGIAALWGDPAIAVAGSKLFISSMAYTQSEFDKVDGANKNSAGCVVVQSGNTSGTYIKGRTAVILRGTSGGTLSAVSGFPSVGELDGGSMVAIGGTVYASYRELTGTNANKALVVKAGETGQITKLPYPALAAHGHPILIRGWVANSTGVSMVVYTGSSTLKLTTYNPATNSWTTPTTIATDHYFGDVSMKSTGMKIRRGGRSYAALRGDLGSNPKVQVFYERVDSGYVRLQGASCTLNSNPPSCSKNSNWVTPANNNSFMPALSESTLTQSTGGHATLWRNYVSYWTDEGRSDGKVVMRFSRLNSTSMTTSGTSNAQAPCADTRGYWGDYDAMYVRSRPLDQWAPLVRPFTDSTNGTCSSKEFVASPQHVSVIAHTPQ